MNAAPFVRLVGVLIGASLAGASSAQVIVSSDQPQLTLGVATRVADEQANDELTSSTLLYGRSVASPLGASAIVKEREPWSSPCATQLCSLATSSWANARGEINPELGRFRSLTSVSVAEPDAAGLATLGLTDVVTFGLGFPIGGPPKLNLHIDLDSGAGTSTELRGYSLFDFTVTLARKDCSHDDFPDGCGNEVFHFHAQDYGGTDIDSWVYTGQEGVILGEGVHVPTEGLDVTIDLFDLGGASVLLGPEYDLRIGSLTYSQCSARSASEPETFCSTHLDASNTVYVGITNLASSTFRYPGQTVDGPGNSVPEPSSLPLLLSGIGLAALGRVHPRRGASGPSGIGTAASAQAD